ncbi:BirA family transcriptional regulator, biotin operon repressor / biotin-[acetyl-CoA-carboxylase] ligase [Salegentibacter holothuriorum]|uniref:BirA family transcriptional regulator, biotin operon repressor / biotin-[acetyl-CoA-carboxylase] ligase n=1 Tax=Salegentibacter holothuriorum TaxID=241145 RepID=A0A1T5D5K0_9FLAO|nr:biotin--[acetyl-CoA-carboxylase] ligase [Salegentibacter holothuriorum]SKB66959.1 BirA family transcriptional regulator, biotin operon repressor / biotin-[acetyl-CoA-carboxylase] ligase [Salegentibacter holothuriorum]
MRTIKVNATNSTNEFARELYRGNTSFEPVCVVAHEQTKGRGQRGSGWESKADENLTFSVLYPKIKVQVNHQFLMSATVSLAILEVLKKFNIPALKVKWPNDIMSARYKISGILIENILKNNEIAASVIGVGLNVNQTNFPGLPQASSLKLATGINFNLDELLKRITDEFEEKLTEITAKAETSILEEYAKNLFRKDKVSTFQLPDASFLTGIIRGVTTSGRLNIEIEDSIFKTFDLKEIKLMY